MKASIEFKNNQGNQISDLKDIKIITLSDGVGNEYTLDVCDGDLKLKYIHNNKREEYTIKGLAEALGSLLNVKNSSGKTVLEEKVSEQLIVEAIMYAKDDEDNRISDNALGHTFAKKNDISEYINKKLLTKADKVELDRKANADSVYTKENIDDKLETKVNIDDVYTKQVIDSELATRVNAGRVYTKEEMDEKLKVKADTFFTYTKKEANERFFPLAEHQQLAKEILGKHINGKSVLVDELGKLFDEQEPWYGNKSDQTAKDFLAEKGNFAKTNGSNIMIPDFAEKILDATEDIGEGKKKSVLVEKLGKFLDQIDDNDKAYGGKTAKVFLGEKGMQEPRGADGLAGKDGIITSPDLLAQALITHQADALGKAILEAKDDANREILVNNSILQEGVAKQLKENPGKAIGPKGNPGQDGESPSVDDVAAKLLIGTNKGALVTEVARNKGLQESLAINKDFSTAVVTALSNDKNFSNIVKRYLSRGEESLSVDNVVTKLLADENKTLVNAIGNNKEVAKKILAATEDTDEKKSILVEKLAGFLNANDRAYDNNERTAKDFLAEKGNFAKTNGSNIMIPDFAEKILDATEDIGEGKKKSVLVEKLGKFLDQIDDNDKAYGGKTAKVFLGEKGMQEPRGADGLAGKDGIITSPDLLAQALITHQADALGKAILEAKDDANREILVNNSILQEGVAKQLKENPGKAIGPKGNPGQDGESPSVDDVAAKLLIGTNKGALVTEVARNKGLQESLAINKDFSTAVVTALSNDKNFSNIVKRYLSRGEESLSVDNVVTKLLADENKTLVNAIGNNKEVAKKILAATEDTDEKKSILVEKLAGFLNANDRAYDNNERTAKDFLAEKGNFAKTNGSNIMIPDFAEKILDATEDIGEGKKKSVLVEKLGKFLDQIDDNDKAYGGKTAKVFLGEKGMQEPRGADGLAGKDGIITSPDLLAQALITHRADALGKAILEAKDDANREILVNNSILQEGVAKQLKENPGKAIGPKGNPGQDGESPSVDDVAAKLLIGTNKGALVTEVARNKGLQESLAINKDFSTAVVTALSNDKNFSNIVKRYLSRGEESLSVDNVVTKLLADENKTLVNAIGNNKEVAKKILAATEDTDEKKSILVEKLAGFLNANDRAYDNNERTAKEFLGSKGLAFANSSDPTFQGAVREVISQPIFEIPDDPNAPLSWDW